MTADQDNNCDIIIDLLKNMRKLDDNITTALNANWDPSNAKNTCSAIHDQLLKSYNDRDSLLKGCIAQSSERVRRVKERKDAEPDNPQVLKSLRKEQTHLRLMQAELSVEQVIRDRSSAIFNNRCRNYYRAVQ